MLMLHFLATILSILILVCGQFKVPDALVEVYHPKGLKVSIPDKDGIGLFAFHGKINEEMNGREAGTFSRDILKAKDGRWTFYEPNAQLKVGDVLYFWTYVEHSTGGPKLGYPKDDQKFEVKELIGADESKPEPRPPTISQPDQSTSTTPKPKPKPKPTPDQAGNPAECKKTITKVKNKAACGQELIFTEPFIKLRRNYWVPEVRFAGDPDYEFVIYDDRPETLFVNKGILHIRPIPTDELYGEGFCLRNTGLDLSENCTGSIGTEQCFQKPDAFYIIPPVSSSRVSTKHKLAFKYGKVEIKAKLPKGDWIYPELFLNPEDEMYGPGYESGQIRIAFLPGNQNLSKILYGGCILGMSNAARRYGLRNIRGDTSWSGEFHKYWVVWREDHITVGVDDTTYGNIYPPEGGFLSEKQTLNLPNADRWRDGTIMAPFDRMMYLTIGVGVGGQCFEERQDGTKPWSNTDPKGQRNFYKALPQVRSTWDEDSTLQVEHVRVWAL